MKFLFMRPSIVSFIRSNDFNTKKKLFYTVLVGDYDHLNEIPSKLDKWDYVCFTDNPNLKSSSWDIHLLENNKNLDPVRLSRHYKINNHFVDRGYDLSIYTDANIRIRGDLDCFLHQAHTAKATMSILLHPFLHSLEQEVCRCIENSKGDRALLENQYQHYLDNGFQDQFPHVNARLMIRRSGDLTVQSFMETWFKQLKTWSKRDQLGFNYSLSHFPELRLNYIPYWIFRRYFKRLDHR